MPKTNKTTKEQAEKPLPQVEPNEVKPEATDLSKADSGVAEPTDAAANDAALIRPEGKFYPNDVNPDAIHGDTREVAGPSSLAQTKRTVGGGGLEMTVINH